MEDFQTLYNLSIEFEKFNQKHSTRPNEHFLEDWQEYFREEIIESLKKRRSYVFLAFVDDTPAGYVYARACKDCYAFIIEELFVKKEYQGNGIGANLLNRVLSIARKFNYDIKVEVFDWNKPAMDFYLKRGFYLESYVLKLNS